ncbi:MAG: hypothetical protein WBG89_13885 [Ornithinimicrobium sp.]
MFRTLLVLCALVFVAFLVLLYVQNALPTEDAASLAQEGILNPRGVLFTV